ncbi:unnamed protein product [Closterium sp. NIES-64]|nr:unnamed protein product [Closterium sp. NIES-64]
MLTRSPPISPRFRSPLGDSPLASPFAASPANTPAAIPAASNAGSARHSGPKLVLVGVTLHQSGGSFWGGVRGGSERDAGGGGGGSAGVTVSKDGLALVDFALSRLVVPGDRVVALVIQTGGEKGEKGERERGEQGDIEARRVVLAALQPLAEVASAKQVRVEVCVCWAADVPQGLLQGALTLGAGIVVLWSRGRSRILLLLSLSFPPSTANVPQGLLQGALTLGAGIVVLGSAKKGSLGFKSSSISSATQDTVAHLARRLPTTTKVMLVSHGACSLSKSGELSTASNPSPSPLHPSASPVSPLSALNTPSAVSAASSASYAPSPGSASPLRGDPLRGDPRECQAVGFGSEFGVGSGERGGSGEGEGRGGGETMEVDGEGMSGAVGRGGGEAAAPAAAAAAAAAQPQAAASAAHPAPTPSPSPSPIPAATADGGWKQDLTVYGREEYGEQEFTLEQILQATDNFNPKNVLGEGGSGQVFLGTITMAVPDFGGGGEGGSGRMKEILAGSKQKVAVKRLRWWGPALAEKKCAVNTKQFLTELRVVRKVRHPNLLRMLGACVTAGELLMVFDYLPNGALDMRLRDNRKPPLTWQQRLEIASGAARGLAFLHSGCRPPIIHRDVKSGNILLDEDLEPVVSDFGLAKVAPEHFTQPMTVTAIMGTQGYVAPEYVRTGKITQAVDVFAFGVVLLELITGHIPFHPSRTPAYLFAWLITGHIPFHPSRTPAYLFAWLITGHIPFHPSRTPAYLFAWASGSVGMCEGGCVHGAIPVAKAGGVSTASGQLTRGAAIPVAKSGEFHRLVDYRLEGRYDPSQLQAVAMLAVICLASNPKDRPAMADVAKWLTSWVGHKSNA